MLGIKIIQPIVWNSIIKLILNWIGFNLLLDLICKFAEKIANVLLIIVWITFDTAIVFLLLLFASSPSVMRYDKVETGQESNKKIYSI